MHKCFILAALLITGCAGHVDYGKSPSPGAVTGCDHILLTVSDLKTSEHFYRDILGLHEEGRLTHFVMLRAGTFGVFLSDKPWEFEKKSEPKGVGVIPHFTTPDMDAFAARLKQNNVPWLREPHKEFFGWEGFITDPDGYQWAILAPVK